MGGGRVRTVAIALWAAIALAAGAGGARAEVEVGARLVRSTVDVGDATALEVTVRGASGGISEPRFDTPEGIEVLSSGRSQSFHWVGGRAQASTVFRYEITSESAGRYTLGPIRVLVGQQWYASPPVVLTVTAAAKRIAGRASRDPASLLVDASPKQPWVGQPVVLRVRLVQRATLAEDPQYVPPATPGFWAGKPSRPQSYYADEGNARVLVTETRTRIYPLASGDARIGQATASLALVVPGGNDPLRWLRGRVPRHEIHVASRPLAVHVRELPAGAPADFDGAVGSYTLSWSADRSSTPQDVPFTVRLDVRGVGNLPLVKSPPFPDGVDAEAFSGTVEDSLPPDGELGAGRRRIQWTVLARHTGRLELPPPAFAWFDPADARYHAARTPAIAIEVGPATRAGTAGTEGFPVALAGDAPDPIARPALPWVWTLAGLAVGAAFPLWRRGSRPPADAGDRARQREWLRAVGLAAGPDFWHAADDAVRWLEQRGRPVARLRADIAGARYGGGRADVEGIRRRVVERLGRALPPPASRGTWKVAGAALGLAGVALAVLFVPRAGDARNAAALADADRAALSGDVPAARERWEVLWRQGSRPAALAARLAWAEVREGRVAQASVWVLRGERASGRDRALTWVRERVREGGGLTGERRAHLPLTALEWAMLGLLAGMAAGLAWPRRIPWLAAMLVAVTAAFLPAIENVRARARDEAVVGRAVALEGAGVELDPGQVVRVLGRAGDRARVEAGRGVRGRVPVAVLLSVGEAR